MGKGKKKLPEVPAASLADIAFMLLIFFLVATQMNVDNGLERRLPQWVEEEQETDVDVNERNVFVVLVNRNNDLLVENEWSNVADLREKAKEFMANPNDDPNLPEKELKDIPILGPTMVSKGVISLQNDRDTKYEMYIAVQNELVGAINDLRNELALSKFGKAFEKCDEDQQEAIKDVYPQKISEAEPKKVGGGK
jgi:biopolymer transport protein ExbD